MAEAEPATETPSFDPEPPGKTQRRVAAVLVVVLVGSLVVHIVTSKLSKEDSGPEAEPLPTVTPVLDAAVTGSSNPLDAERAFGYLSAICELGPRPSGSVGMREQQELVATHFEEHGAEVRRQTFRVRNPLGGPRVAMTNIIARWRLDEPDRVLLCAHYDTRPLPDRDPNPIARRRGRFIGANDGASGVAALMELAHLLAVYDGPLGVDVVLFDGEELVYVDRRDPYFLGSRYFAEAYKKRKPLPDGPPWRYRAAILLDMVGDADLQLYQERYSYRNEKTRPLVLEVWSTAQRLGVEEFIPRVKHTVRDDHLALQRYGDIPAIDIIDFDYPAWHTESDTPRRCSGDSLAKVGWVVWEWLLSQRANPVADAS
ncbi:MAG: M28 family peptidase [Planctomycetota bacterium]